VYFPPVGNEFGQLAGFGILLVAVVRPADFHTNASFVAGLILSHCDLGVHLL
jgi:hypothetical protein